MIRPLTGPLTATLFAAGCITGHVGVDAPLAEDREPMVALDLRAGVDGPETLVAWAVRTRIGDGGADVGLGADLCVKPPRAYVQPRLCGRLMPLELGARRGDFVLGLGSFAMGPGVWIPFGPRGPKVYDPDLLRGTAGLWIQGWGGLDIRPLDDRKFTQTFGIRIGGGMGGLYHRAPEDD